jgi:hypothetical protein
MDSATVNGDLFMRDGAEFAGPVKMQSVTIGKDIRMDDSNFERKIDLSFADIRGSLNLVGASLPGLDLTGTRIEAEFRLAERDRLPKWSKNAKLTLRNTEVGALQDSAEEEGVFGDRLSGSVENYQESVGEAQERRRTAWPKSLDLDGFTYQRLGGLNTDVGTDALVTDVAGRGSTWFVEWLAKDEPYTPQPYEQLAKVLGDMGHGQEANDVLYAGRERARERAWNDGDYFRWLGGSLLKLTIGYGYGCRYFRALYWVAVMVALGLIVLRCTEKQREKGERIGLWYSLEMLLPIVELRKEHYDIKLERFALYYFYFHKMMGFVLASFLIAGLSGLAK